MDMKIEKQNSTTHYQIIAGKVCIVTERNKQEEWMNEERF